MSSNWPASKSFAGIETYEDFLRALAENIRIGVTDKNALYVSVKEHPAMMSEDEWLKGKKLWEIISHK